MSDSILTSVKKVLGLDEAYDAFDIDIIMHINSALSTVGQLGVGPVDGFSIADATATWDDFLNGDLSFNDVKSYIYMRVRMLFDPPTNPRLYTAIETQVREVEWRINITREFTPFEALYPPPSP